MMVEGLFISIVGMGAVFLSLIVIMFLMVGIERVFRSEENEVEEGSAANGMIPLIEPVQTKLEPEGADEVAAIALALASYLRGRDKKLGTSIIVNDKEFQVEIEDIANLPTSVVINGESYLGAVGEQALPFVRRSFLRIGQRGKGVRRERTWRSAHPLSLGGYWSRHGWTGKQRRILKG